MGNDDFNITTQLVFQSMTYDDADRLTSVIQKNPLTGDNVKKMEYEYDGLSRRRVSTTYTWNAGTTSWTQQEERHFIYDGMDLIQERDGSNTVIASYVRDGNIGGVLSRTTSSGTFYYHYDGNGNVVAMTNASGATVAQYTYDAYGNITSMSGSQAASNPIRFSTKYLDTNTGYYDFGFRSYDPVTGRWLNRDPIGESGGLNLYGFVGNSPGNMLDGYGTDSVFNAAVKGGIDALPGTWVGSFQLLYDWYTESGSTHRWHIGLSDPLNRNMRRSKGGQEMISAFKNGGCKSDTGFFSTKSAATQLYRIDNSTQFQVGGFKWRATNNGNGTVTYRIYNQLSIYSFYLHHPEWFGLKGKKARGEGIPYMGIIHQYFQWTEDLP